jgi:hypothetical protein
VGRTVSSVGEVQSSALGLDDLLGGLVGAVLVFLFTVVYTEIWERRQGVKESAGLARLLLHEVERNEDAVEIRTGGAVRSYARNLPTVDSWLEARMRLAQLIKRKDFEVIADYYQVLQTLRRPLEPYAPHNPNLNMTVEFPSDERGWEERTADVKSRLQRYAESN